VFTSVVGMLWVDHSQQLSCVPASACLLIVVEDFRIYKADPLDLLLTLFFSLSEAKCILIKIGWIFGSQI